MDRLPAEITENGIHYALHADCYTRERNDPENRMWRHGIYGNQSKIRSGFL